MKHYFRFLVLVLVLVVECPGEDDDNGENDDDDNGENEDDDNGEDEDEDEDDDENEDDDDDEGEDDEEDDCISRLKVYIPKCCSKATRLPKSSEFSSAPNVGVSDN